MRIRVSELTDEKLAEWAARAQGWVKYKQGIMWWQESEEADHFIWTMQDYRPDINVEQAMELAKKFGLVVYFAINSVSDGRGGKLYQNNAIEIAICHAVVASVFGEEVDDAS